MAVAVVAACGALRGTGCARGDVATLCHFRRSWGFRRSDAGGLRALGVYDRSASRKHVSEPRCKHVAELWVPGPAWVWGLGFGAAVAYSSKVWGLGFKAICVVLVNDL